ncbi:MAG: sigma-54 dependent transcriptional regulator [Calditrichaceae bacterium]|jgi:two-component system, NtrC family, response regulator AtoC
MDEPLIIGQSQAIKDVIQTAKKLAKSNTITTLIIGENGTGKELVAQLIHTSGQDPNRPFVDINCGAIPEYLLESELFGHEKGSFTGAYVSKKGLLEVANGGTIFLDEIGNMPLGLQNKLLKAVETKRIRPIGGLKETNINTRIIAASNADLSEAVKTGDFRQDLYYRLNIGRIFVPPLRERGEDVLLLAEHFIDYYNHEHRRNIKGLAPQTRELFKRYAWPGNVRELQNAIARASLLEITDWIGIEHLDIDLKNQKTITPHFDTSQFKTKSHNGFRDFKMPTDGIPLEELERTIFTTALKKARGNLSHAARLLSISRGKLRYKLEKLNITY